MRITLSLADFRRLVRLAIVGCAAGASYAATFALVARIFELPVFFASTAGFLVGIPISYFGNRRFTYRSTNAIGSELGRFVTVQLGSLIVTSVLLQVLAIVAPTRLYVSIVAALLTAPVISLIMFEIWVYRQKGGRTDLT